MFIVNLFIYFCFRDGLSTFSSVSGLINFFFSLMNGNTEQTYRALSRVCIPYEKEEKGKDI